MRLLAIEKRPGEGKSGGDDQIGSISPLFSPETTDGSPPPRIEEEELTETKSGMKSEFQREREELLTKGENGMEKITF